MDVIEGCAPFVLTMTLEYSPEDTESLLGFKPQNGTNYYGLYDFPDKRCYYNIMRGMGTLIERLSLMTYYNMRHKHHKRDSWIKRLLSLTRHGWLSAWARKRP